jgi:hydrogenase maturation protease
MTKIKKQKPVILGLGNPLFQDEGLGIHIVHHLMGGELEDQAELIDGGTDGLLLLGTVEAAQQLIIIDAINGDFPAGTIKSLAGDEIPLFANGKLSPHQLSFQEVLALARMRGKLPDQIVLLGVQSESLDWGTNLSPKVANSVPMVINLVYRQIEKWLV